MRNEIRCQGRTLGVALLRRLQNWIDEHPQWTRSKLAEQLARRWKWRTRAGQYKSFAARSLLLKLEKQHGLRLPPAQVAMRRASAWGVTSQVGLEGLVSLVPVEESLASLRPLSLEVVRRGHPQWPQVQACLQIHHYRSFNRPVGEHLCYWVEDRHSRALALVLFGAAAWQCAARDQFIGWDSWQRRQHLWGVINNSRFLILPGIRVPHLASHLLGHVNRRLCSDWQAHYGHPIYLVESFVECSRFTGTTYRAANWRYLGQTTGRTRQSSDHRQHEEPKALFVYPLHRNFRFYLQGGAR